MITIVSGLPRSGTSLMMQMLNAGGLPVLSDGERQADTDNPKGYLEWERIKQLPKDPSLIAEAEGKVVKVISQLLLSLPSDHEYRVVFMQRPLPEVLKPQEEMLRRRGNADSSTSTSAIEEVFQRHLIEVNKWLAGKANGESRACVIIACCANRRQSPRKLLHSCRSRSTSRPWFGKWMKASIAIA